MKKYFSFLAAAAILFVGFGCSPADQTKTTNSISIPDNVVVVNDDVVVQQVAETSGVISKTFESENGDFSYTLNWNTNVLTLADTQYKWSTEHAPSFDIVGGGTITVATGWIDSPGYHMSSFINDTYYDGNRVWPTTQPNPSEAGTSNPIYFFSQPVEMNKGCIIQYAVIKGLNEALAIRLEDCAGNDMKSSEAFGDLYDDLTIVRH